MAKLRPRLEEPEEPEEPDQPEPDEPEVELGQPVPTVGGPPGLGRTFEYRSEVLSHDQVSDGTLVEKLNQESSDGWDLVDMISAGDKQVLLMRRPKRAERESRPVGFLRPG